MVKHIETLKHISIKRAGVKNALVLHRYDSVLLSYIRYVTSPDENPDDITMISYCK